MSVNQGEVQRVFLNFLLRNLVFYSVYTQKCSEKFCFKAVNMVFMFVKVISKRTLLTRRFPGHGIVNIFELSGRKYQRNRTNGVRFLETHLFKKAVPLGFIQ